MSDQNTDRDDWDLASLAAMAISTKTDDDALAYWTKAASVIEGIDFEKPLSDDLREYWNDIEAFIAKHGEDFVRTPGMCLLSSMRCMVKAGLDSRGPTSSNKLAGKCLAAMSGWVIELTRP